MPIRSLAPALDIRRNLLAREAWLRDACGPALPPSHPPLIERVRLVIEQWRDRNTVSEYQPTAGWQQGIPQHILPSLAAAYSVSTDETIAQCARSIYQVIMDAEPWHQGWRPAKRIDPLVVPHRLGDTECAGWFGALPAFLDSPTFDDAFLRNIVESAVNQLEYLSENPHEGRNIRLSQADALLTQGIRLNALPQAARWRAIGVHILNDGFHRLIAPDGASREATTWYHAIIMNMGLRLWRLGRADATLGLTIDPAKIARMFDYTLASIEPDGRSTRIGDTVGHVTPGGTLESFILRRDAAVKELGFESPLPDPAQWFASVKQAMIRTDFTERADYLTFDATTRYGHHWHPGRNSLQLCVGGRRVLADPGRMRYEDTPLRRYAVSTRGHGTINFNGWDQSDVDASLRVESAPGCRLIDGIYAGGYWRRHGHEIGEGIHARHQRTVIWLIDRFLLVIDHVSHNAGADSKPDIESHWHFAPGEVTLDADGRVARATHGDARLDLHLALQPTDARVSLHEGEVEPSVIGWAAHDVSDDPQPAPSLRVHIPRYDPWRLDLATLLVPGSTTKAPGGVTVREAHDASEKGYAHLHVVWADGSADCFWWTRQLALALDDKVAGVATDASLLHQHHDASGRLRRVTIVDGTFAGPWFVPPRAAPGLHTVELEP